MRRFDRRFNPHFDGHFHRRFVGLAVLLLLGGCASSSSLFPPEVLPPDRVASCPEWRWVGLKPDAAATCPVPASGTWEIRPFSGTPAAEPAVIAGQTGASTPDPTPSGRPSRGLCQYVSPKKHAVGRAVRDLYRQGVLEAIYPDCAMVGSLAEPGLAEQTWQDLQSHLFAQVGETTGLEDGASDPSVRLVVLDTQPRKLWTQRQSGTSPHGWFVAHLGRRLVCGYGEGIRNANSAGDASSAGESCAAEVDTRLVMPLKTFFRKNPGKTEQDDENGGYFGRVSDLIEAIGEELDANQGTGTHLVLNLSLGWEGAPAELGGSLLDMPVLARALYQVLEEAACRGVIVIAAAGNRSGEASSGLLLPAAWVNRSVEPAACAGIPGAVAEERGAWSGSPGFPRPLIYAVGGVDSEGRPLSNARVQGMPELAAFGDHAVVETFDPLRPTKTYTGSSVAAGVVSAVAAVVWSRHPDWSSHEVMEHLYASGCELSQEADVVASPPLGVSAGGTQLASLGIPDLALGSGSQRPFDFTHRVRRISLARALGQVSASQQRFVSLASRGSCPSLGPPDLEIHLDAGREVDVSTYQSTSTLSQAGCAAGKITALAPPGASLSSELVSALCSAGETRAAMEDPWTGPQPQDPPCPNCTLEPQGTGPGGLGLLEVDHYILYIEIDTDWPAKLTLSNPTLMFDNTALPLSSPSDPVVLKSGETMTVDNIPVNLVQTAQRIVLVFTTDDGPVENPVLVAK